MNTSPNETTDHLDNTTATPQRNSSWISERNIRVTGTTASLKDGIHRLKGSTQVPLANQINPFQKDVGPDSNQVTNEPVRSTLKTDGTAEEPHKSVSSEYDQRKLGKGNNEQSYNAWSPSTDSGSTAMTVGLAVSLAVGILLFVVVIVLVGMRHYDSYRLSDYSAVSHLIDGMYN